MPALHIRNLDGAIIDALKERAKANNRSLEGELREILRQVAFGTAGERAVNRRMLRIKRVSVGSPSRYGREDIYGPDDG